MFSALMCCANQDVRDLAAAISKADIIVTRGDEHACSDYHIAGERVVYGTDWDACRVARRVKDTARTISEQD
jgi:hypothetical protein